MKQIEAKIVADSLSPQGTRLTTFVLTFPRMILTELNTHRMFSRNSASSRAIPFEKMVKMCKEDPFIPLKWMKDHSGMQGSEYFSEGESDTFNLAWLVSRNKAIEQAEFYNKCGVSKQICNRLLEPFMWHTVLLSATDFENFFSLRVNEGAEIHMQKLASKMLESYNSSTPIQLKDDEWHIPFGDNIKDPKIFKILLDKFGDRLSLDTNDPVPQREYAEAYLETKIKICSACCARISYNTFEGKNDYKADIDLHDRLLENGHMSAFEHVAKVMNTEEWNWSSLDTFIDGINKSIKGYCGNFRGFIQYRKMFENENRTDSRVKKCNL